MSAAQAQAPQVLALLSDLDGTLIDTEPLYYAAYRAAAQRLGSADWTHAQHVQHMLGRPQDEGIAAFLRELGLAATVPPAEVLRLRDDTLLPSFASVPLLPGAAAAIAQCRAAGLRLAIVTSSKSALMALKMAPHAAFLAQFELVVCNDSPLVAGLPGKPHPAPYTAAAAALGLRPAQCMVWEDSLQGVASGVAAGCGVVALPDARIPAAEVAAARPALVLPGLEAFELGSALRALAQAGGGAV